MPNNKKLEKIIDELCKNLDYAWRYYFTLEALHEQAKSDDSIINDYSLFFLTIYWSLFDALFLRIAHFTGRGKNVVSLPHLHKKIEEYYPNDHEVKKWISEDRAFLTNHTDLQRIENWRHKVVAHLSSEVFLRDSDFFEENKLHLLEIREILEFFEQLIKKYGFHFLARFDYTRSTNVKKVTDRLFKCLRRVS